MGLAVVIILTPVAAQQTPGSKDKNRQKIENVNSKNKINPDNQKNQQKESGNKSEKIRRTLKRNKEKLRLLPDKTATYKTNDSMDI